MIKWNILSAESIITFLRPTINEEILKTYFSLIYDTLSTPTLQSNSSSLSLEAFEEYMNMPLIITGRLYQVILAQGGNAQITKEEFAECMTRCYKSRSIEVITHFTFELMDCYNTKLILEEDIRLLLYYFHSITNKSSIDQIDTILSQCFANNKKEISYEEYKESLANNSDLLFLLLFYFRSYQPFDKEILEFCSKCKCKDTKDLISNEEIANKESDDMFMKIAKPSDALVCYLKNEFQFDINDVTSSSSSSDIQEQEEPKSSFNNEVGDYLFTKKHLIVLSEGKIFPLINLALESSSSEGESNQKINVYRLKFKYNQLQISINVKEEEFNTFLTLFHQFNPIRNIEDYYTLGQVINQGNYSVIKIALKKFNLPHSNNNTNTIDTSNTTNKPYIVKIINKIIPCGYKWDKDISKFLMKNTHPNVINCIDIFENCQSLFLVFEYHYNGSLLDYLMNCYDKLSFDQITVIINQLLSGLSFLQRYGIVHRDIKPENILISEPFNAKINDFGFSKVMFSKEKANESYGSLCYASPEIIQHQWYTHKTDLWSIGVISYYLQYAELPFNDEDETEEEFNNIAKKIIKCNYYLPNDEENMVNTCTLASQAIKLFLIAEAKRVNLKDFMVKYVNTNKGNQ